jgi:3'(2'), 5'-bisphosphate nucleotidase
MLEKELQAARDIALEAGELVLKMYAVDIIAEEKLGVDNLYEPVTAADRGASRLIIDRLEAMFPGDAMLSEEEADTPDTRLAAERVWIIDPIDGTAGFVKKDGDFGVQIGLSIKGEAVLGVVYLPLHKKLYWAAKGSGAFSESDSETKRLSVSAKTDFKKMCLAITRHHYSKNMAKVMTAFRFLDTCRRGSVGLKIGLITEQECDIYIHLSPRTKLWDTCGPQVILEEAGGRLTDIFGYPLRYDVLDLQNHNGILATNGVSHDAAVKKLGPILHELERYRIITTSSETDRHLRTSTN